MIIRHPELKVIYNSEINISQDINADLISVSYTDNIGGCKDDLQVTIADPSSKWLNTWFPTKGDSLDATIFLDGKELNCGKFAIDEISYSKPPSVMTIKSTSGVSKIAKTDSKGTNPITGKMALRRTRNFTTSSLRDLAQKCANECGLKLSFNASKNPIYYHSSQQNESDFEFLSKLAKSRNLECKSTPEKIIILDPQKAIEYSPNAEAIEIHENEVINWAFSTVSIEQVGSVTVSYYDPMTKKKISYTEKGDKSQGKELKLNIAVKDIEEAKDIAKARLEQRVAKEVTGTINLPGRCDLVAGQAIKIVGFGQFSGTYKIDNAVHSISSAGYSLSLKVKK